MPRILGHLPGSIEQLEQKLFKLLHLPQPHSRGQRGLRVSIQAKATLQHDQSPDLAAHKAVAGSGQSHEPLHIQSQLRGAERDKESIAAVFGSSQREAIVLSALDAAGITDLNERAMFMAQMSHESKAFTRLTENLNYKPARLLAIFPKKFSSLEDAHAVVGGGQVAIAERIYGNRKALGNVLPGDGFRYRGRGIVQLTGRSNYRSAGHAIGVDLETSPERAADLDVAVKAALWFWQSKGIVGPAREGDVAKVTRLINGGTIGLAERSKEYGVWKQRMLAETAPTIVSQRLP